MLDVAAQVAAPRRRLLPTPSWCVVLLGVDAEEAGRQGAVVQVQHTWLLSGCAACSVCVHCFVRSSLKDLLLLMLMLLGLGLLGMRSRWLGAIAAEAGLAVGWGD